ncbi:MAG TPA: hypothetical protein VFW73_08150 [Lacipirellulaceae bacterium]|nr:hypothetical protein [Lacipirellulaceae bacterium]
MLHRSYFIGHEIGLTWSTHTKYANFIVDNEKEQPVVIALARLKQQVPNV